jgi:hypothetical protein
VGGYFCGYRWSRGPRDRIDAFISSALTNGPSAFTLYAYSLAKEEQAGAGAARRKGRGQEALDERVNARLLCLHGKRSLRAKGPAVTTVGQSTWELIRSLYPGAIELRADQEVSVRGPVCLSLSLSLSLCV